MREKVYLYGKNPLKEAFLAKERGLEDLIEKLYLTRQAEADPKIIGLIQAEKMDYEIITPGEIEALVGRNALHQGICAIINENSLYADLDGALKAAKDKSESSLFVLLDELEDPHNVGAIIRSAVAFGADAVLMPEHNQTLLNGTVIKASSGMIFSIPIVKIGNINTTLKKLKDNGFWTYGLTGSGDTKLSETKFDTSCVIVIGGEGKGIREKTLEHCDFKLSISIDPKCESLNASNAAAVTLYEWRKQNKN
ncbi:MAG: ribose methyltransferase substrate binding family protein [Candidatus Nomurabacteria bacterium]|nr:ribose methyltransferase substrate binding family protein [Candidatus Nomurabacteria bacterium]